MSSSEEEQIYSIALTMVPGIGHIGAKHLIDGMNNAVDIFRLRKEIPERIPEVRDGYKRQYVNRILYPDSFSKRFSTDGNRSLLISIVIFFCDCT